MIKVPLAFAFMLYLGLTLGSLLCLWTYHNFSHWRKKSLPHDKGLFMCEYCQSFYLDEVVKNVTQCPQCQSFNQENQTSPYQR